MAAARGNRALSLASQRLENRASALTYQVIESSPGGRGNLARVGLALAEASEALRDLIAEYERCVEAAS